MVGNVQYPAARSKGLTQEPRSGGKSVAPGVSHGIKHDQIGRRSSIRRLHRQETKGRIGKETVSSNSHRFTQISSDKNKNNQWSFRNSLRVIL
jgi:hypothetical protein